MLYLAGTYRLPALVEDAPPSEIVASVVPDEEEQVVLEEVELEERLAE